MNKTLVRIGIPVLALSSLMFLVIKSQPTKQQEIAEAQRMARGFSGVWSFDGVTAFVSPLASQDDFHSPAPVYYSLKNPKSSILFHEDNRFDSVSKRQRVKLVYVPQAIPGKSGSSMWEDYVKVQAF